MAAHNTTIPMLSLLLLLMAIQTSGQIIGVCYGMYGNNLPQPNEVIKLYQSNNFGRMRLYAPETRALNALRGTNIELIVDVTNEALQNLASDQAAATSWVQGNVSTYFPDVAFRVIIVGNEVSTNKAQFVLPAMKNIYNALTAAGLQDVDEAVQVLLRLYSDRRVDRFERTQIKLRHRLEKAKFPSSRMSEEAMSIRLTDYLSLNSSNNDGDPFEISEEEMAAFNKSVDVLFRNTEPNKATLCLFYLYREYGIWYGRKIRSKYLEFINDAVLARASQMSKDAEVGTSEVDNRKSELGNVVNQGEMVVSESVVLNQSEPLSSDAFQDTSYDFMWDLTVTGSELPRLSDLPMWSPLFSPIDHSADEARLWEITQVNAPSSSREAPIPDEICIPRLSVNSSIVDNTGWLCRVSDAVQQVALRTNQMSVNLLDLEEKRRQIESEKQQAEAEKRQAETVSRQAEIDREEALKERDAARQEKEREAQDHLNTRTTLQEELRVSREMSENLKAEIARLNKEVEEARGRALSISTKFNQIMDRIGDNDDDAEETTPAPSPSADPKDDSSPAPLLSPKV